MGEPDRRDSSLSDWLNGLAHDLPDGEVTGYVALGGKNGEPSRGFAIVQLPGDVGPAAVGRHMESPRASVSQRIAAALEAHAAHALDLEQALAEKTTYADELEAERDHAQARERAALADRDALEQRIEALQAENRELRTRAATAEGEAMRARMERGEDAAAEPDGAERAAALEAELEETRARLERATRSWREADAKSDAAWRRVGEIQTELDEHRERSVARSAEQRRAAQLTMVKAMEDASAKLVGVRDQLLRCEKRCDELEAALRASEAARAELEARAEDSPDPDGEGS